MSVAVCESQPVGVVFAAIRIAFTSTGDAGLLMSKMWSPSKPWPTSWPA